MFESKDNESNFADQHQEPADAHEPRADYLSAAREAKRAGDKVLAMHLYMTAYEESCKRSPLPDMDAIGALREAWEVACDLRERSMAEYIFDKLEPHLTGDETEQFARRLQDLALDKLSEFGISRADLEDMADLISEEIGAHAHISGITPIVSALYPESEDGAGEEQPEGQLDELEVQAQQGDQSDAVVEGEASSTESASADAPAASKARIVGVGKLKSAKGKDADTRTAPRRTMDFSDLVGFDGIIEDTRALGIGVKQDEAYRLLIDTLRAQHGLDKLSANGTVVYRTSSREDASVFMTAVVGELGLPAMRVQMQPGPQGMPVLCVTVSADRQPRLTGRMTLDAPGVLVLEDIDLWGAPLIEAASASDGEGIMFANMARAAREAITLISTAVANPDIYVLASMAGDAPDQGYLYDLMEPMHIVDIYLPDELERRAIWDCMALDHPSIRQLDLSRLTRLSRNLSRTDIATAAREAVEDAYRQGLKSRHYVPVTQEMMYEHISNFQPLDSDEYHQLEDAVVKEFRAQIERFEAEGGRLGADDAMGW